MKKIPAIDGLRGIAALLVFCLHASVPFIIGGGIGVDIFFAISGFLITRTFNQSNNNLEKFWFYRFFRIYPPLIIVVSVSCVVFYLFKEVSLLVTIKNFFPSILGVANFARITIDAPTFIGHIWSIGVEEQFYLVYPIALLLIIKISPKHTDSIIFCLAFFLVLYRIALFKLFHCSAGDLFNRTDTRVDGLLWGAGLAIISSDKMKIIARFWPIAIIFLFATAFFEKWHQSWLYLGGFSLLSICSCVLLAKLFLDEQSVLGRTFAFYPLRKIGEVSYGFYLWHFPVIHFFEDKLAPQSPILNILILFLITLTLSLVSWRAIEKPFLAKRPSYFSKWKKHYIYAVIAWMPVSLALGGAFIALILFRK